MGQIFVSYRRVDSRDQTGRISDRLASAFSRDRVFKDVDSIPPGADFRKVIEVSIRESELVILVIGSSWLTIADDDGNRRLDDENDWVRLELESALKLDKLVIPVLVRDASMPRPNQLPATIREVAFRNFVKVRSDPDFDKDMEHLIHAIKDRKAEKYRGKPGPQPPRKIHWMLYALGSVVVAGLISSFVIYMNVFNFGASEVDPRPPGVANPIVMPGAPPKLMPFPPVPGKAMPEGYEVPPRPPSGTEVAQSGPPRGSPQGPVMMMPTPVPPAPSSSGDSGLIMPVPVPPAPVPSSSGNSDVPPAPPDTAPPAPAVPSNPTTPPASLG